jgi:hypothetical protein
VDETVFFLSSAFHLFPLTISSPVFCAVAIEVSDCGLKNLTPNWNTWFQFFQTQFKWIAPTIREENELLSSLTPLASKKYFWS